MNERQKQGVDCINVLLIVDSYVPETTSAAKMIYDLATEFVRRGHDVTVLNSKWDCPEKLVEGQCDGINVLTVRGGKRPGDGLLARAIAEVLLPFRTWMSVRRRLLNKRCDLVVFYSPTIFWGWIVRRLGRRRGAATYLILRDLFPEWTVDIGLIRRNSLTYHFFAAVARYQYRVADRIGVESPSNLQKIQLLYPECSSKLEVLWNWISDSLQEPISNSANTLPRQSGKVIFLYGGNLGVAQGVRHLIALARWAHSRDDVRLMVVGSGSGYAQLQWAIDLEKLQNVTLSPPIPQGEYTGVLHRADVGIVLLDPSLTMHNIPGKLVSYAMAGKPILADMNGSNDLVNLLHEFHAGLVTSGDETAFVENAVRLVERAELRLALGEGARKLARAHFSVKACASQVLSSVSR